MAEKNLKLATKIKEKDTTQRELSKKAGIPESYISYHLHGRWNFNRVEQEKIAEVLGVDSREIFAESTGA